MSLNIIKNNLVRVKMALKVLFIFMISFVISGCSARPQSTVQEKLPDTGHPALHAVTDAKLRELMSQMNGLMFDNYKTEPDIDRERRQYAKRIAELADTLSSVSDIMLSRMPALNLSADEQVIFQALDNKLREQANLLKMQAQLNRIDALDQTKTQIKQTCTSCHSLFRSHD